ncbi:MAG TPA: hypothetical protein VIL20_14420, partial [Sandaracinaceae bacterium]
MRTNTKLVLGGLAGVVAAGGLVAGLFALAGEPHAAAPPREQRVEPVPAPALEPELASTAAPAPGTAIDEARGEEAERYGPELASGAIRVRRLVVATGVEGREPTGAADVFRLGAQRRLYAFVEAVNETDDAATLRVTFEPDEGESVGHVALQVPANAARFRTWAYTRHVYT